MKKFTLPILLLGLIIFLFTACPYASKVPIDKANVKVDSKLIGKWVKASDMTKENPKFFEISEIGEFKYNIFENEYNTSDSAYKQTLYVSHITEIEDLKFLNMQKDGQGDYYLHKIEMGSDEFTLFELTDNIDEKYNTSEELKSFVKKHMKLSFFYNKDETKYLKSK